MKTLGFALIALSLALTGCASKPQAALSTTTSLATHAVRVKNVLDAQPDFRDDREFSNFDIVTSTAESVEEIGGGTCLIYIKGGINYMGVYGILGSCSLNLAKGSTVYYRYGRSIYEASWETYPIAISKGEVDALISSGWHMRPISKYE